MSNEFINLGSTKNHEDFQLRYISFSKYEGDWQSLPHTHQFSELFYVLHGEGVFYIENEKISVKTDDLMIINPNVEHTERTLPNNPMEYIVFGVEGLAFSFTDSEQETPKGYSFYSYGSDKSASGISVPSQSLKASAPKRFFNRIVSSMTSASVGSVSLPVINMLPSK